MKYLIHTDRLLTADGWKNDRLLEITDGKITRITEGRCADFHADFLTPGLFDTHIHGGCGYNFDDAGCTADKIEEWLRVLRKSGVSAVLMTFSAAPFDTLRNAAAETAEVMRRQQEGREDEARVLGIHFEGPFISPKKAGAINPASMLAPSEEACRALLAGCEDITRIMTFAPEQEGADGVLNVLKEEGILPQIGHSAASYEEGDRAFQNGAGSVCHFFNAAPPIHHREPGFLTAALLTPHVYCEAITDLVHLHPAALRLLYQNKGADRMVLISDAGPAVHLPDGVLTFGNRTYVKKDGAIRNPAGALSGGSVFLPGAVKNAVSVGIPLEDAVKMASFTPAARIGVHLPAPAVGEDAFLLGWSSSLDPAFTVAGESVVYCE